MKHDKTAFILFFFIVLPIWCLVLVIGALSIVAVAAELPNTMLTPGAVRVVDQHTLCTTSTQLVRNVPQSEKLAVYREYGMDKPRTGYCATPSGCEVDHLISLELGGSNDLKNLWPQSYDGACNAHIKDKLENKLHALICAGTITMQEAQSAISTDWEAAYTKYVNPRGCK